MILPAERPRVAVEQTAPEVGAVDRNLADAERRIQGLAGRADLVVFPELFTTGYRREGMDHAALAEPVPDGPSVRRLSNAARGAGVAVVGTILERDGDAVFDTAVLIGRDGELMARYRKTHLYPAEAAFFSAGDELVVASIDPGLRVGLAICFEHAFPEIFTSLALAGASLIAISSAVPVGFEYLLDLRTRARAQDNQLFVASANLVGFDGQVRWCGRSAIVDPRGDVVAAANAADAMGIVAELDLGVMDGQREQEQSLARRRPELYRDRTPGR
ncbi:carbon-nitrogen hydrolase family protein [soil metagenome]